MGMKMSLLDSSVEYYVVQKKSWEFGSAAVYNLSGEKIGVIKYKSLPMRTTISLEESDGKLLCIINRLSIGETPIYDVKDPDDTIIARVKVSLTEANTTVSMYDTDDKEIFKTWSGITQGRLEIYNPNDKERVYAIIERTDKVGNLSQSVFEFKDKYEISIMDSSVDRIMLLSYALIIDNLFQNKW